MILSSETVQSVVLLVIVNVKKGVASEARLQTWEKRGRRDWVRRGIKQFQSDNV